MNARNATTESFAKDVLQNDKLVLVDFWATWCPPCRAVAPILEQIAEAHAGEVDVVKVDIDAFPDLARQYAIRSIPSMKIFKNGQLVDAFEGAMPKANIEARLAKHMDAE